MSNAKKSATIALSKQGSLFDSDIAEGALDVSALFRDVLSRVISHCRDSRYQIAAKMSELTRRNISKDMLDKYTASDQAYALRAEDLPAVCRVAQSVEPVRILLTPLGCDIVTPDDLPYVRLARLIEQRNTLDKEIAALESRHGIKFKP